jgi:PAS domain S-box-containing protein
MQTQAVPPLVMAGIAFYVGFYQLLTYLRGRDHRYDLTFGLTCLTVGAYDVFCAGLYDVASVADGVVWQRAQLATLALVALAFLWFVADYAGARERRPLYFLSACHVVFAVAQIVDRSHLTLLTGSPSIKQVRLPFGLEVTYLEVQAGILTNVQSLFGLALVGYVLWLAARAVRTDRRRRAVPLLWAVAVFSAGVLNDTLVTSDVYRFAYLIEYGFMAMVVLMAFSLSATVAETAGALRESEGKFRSVVENAHAGILIVDDAYRFTYANDELCRIVGYPRAEIIGHDFREFLDEESRALVGERYLGRRRGEEPPSRYEFTIVRKDGETRHTEISAAVVRDAAGKGRTVGQLLDITERRRAEDALREKTIELEQRNAELERFTYTVSHDLKSPLVTITGFLGYLKSDLLAGDTARAQVDIERITQATERMDRLLQELLELSRVGRAMNPPEPLMFSTIVEEACELQHGILQSRGVVVEVAPDLPEVRGDRTRLVEVVQNLIDNACRFMGDQREPRVTIGSRGRDPEGKAVLFVRDNGMGIDPKHQERVFGLFEKLDAGSEGTGIGLALVRRIVEVHGGRVWVESEPGRGSTFLFTL